MLQFQLQPQDGFVIVYLSGLVSPEGWAQGLPQVERAVRAGPLNRAVLDMGGVVGWLGEPERRVVGALMAIHLSGLEKVAVVVEAQKITGVVEEEATRGGLLLRLFTAQEDAVRWVLS
jgi:hypothetical protein